MEEAGALGDERAALLGAVLVPGADELDDGHQRRAALIGEHADLERVGKRPRSTRGRRLRGPDPCVVCRRLVSGRFRLPPRRDVDLELGARVGVLLGEKLPRQPPLVERVRDARGPVGMERVPVMDGMQRRSEVITKPHGSES